MKRAIKDLLIDAIEEIERNMLLKAGIIKSELLYQTDYRQALLFQRALYISWPIEVLESYKLDLEQAQKHGNNLMSEKYARMREIALRETLEIPPLDLLNKRLIEEAVDILLGWEANLCGHYRLLQEKARSLRQKNLDAASVPLVALDVYLFGEFSIYSARTLSLYLKHLIIQERQDINGSMMVYDNMSYLQSSVVV